MVDVSHADRIVFPEIGRTKGDVVTYYERIAPRLLPHVAGRPLSITPWHELRLASIFPGSTR